MRADPLLADKLNTFYGRFESNRGCATLPISASESGSQSSDNHVITVMEDSAVYHQQSHDMIRITIQRPRYNTYHDTGLH